MTAQETPADLLTLHAVRLLGLAATTAVAARFELDPEQTEETLLDAEAVGWVRRSRFPEEAGWSLTEAGRRQEEEQLGAELDRAGAREAVADVHARFLPLNAEATRVLTACQLADGDPAPGAASPAPPAELAGLADALRPLAGDLAARLTRFTGYHARFAGAVARARTDRQWLTGLDVDSCHRVWFELHEDLIATLGLTR